MKSHVNKVIFCLLITALTNLNIANGSILEKFKDPATLILNNNNCSLYNGVKLEVVDGQVLYKNTVVIAYITKLDKSRVQILFTDQTTPLVLTIKKIDDELFANLPNGNFLIRCPKKL